MKTQGKAPSHGLSSTGASIPSKPTGTRRSKLALPCIEVRIAADVIGKNGAHSPARMLRLYRDGTSLAMDVTSARGVFPDGSVRPGTPLRLGFGLRVGESEQSVKVDALCQLVGSRRVGEDLLCVDLRFAGFAKNSGRRVERFILDAMSYEWD